MNYNFTIIPIDPMLDLDANIAAVFPTADSFDQAFRNGPVFLGSNLATVPILTESALYFTYIDHDNTDPSLAKIDMTSYWGLG